MCHILLFKSDIRLTSIHSVFNYPPSFFSNKFKSIKSFILIQKMKWFSLFILFLIFLFKRNVVTINLDRFISSNSTNECEIMDKNYWTTIQQFYGSVNLISIYFIHPHKPNSSNLKLSSILLEQIPKSMSN